MERNINIPGSSEQASPKRSGKEILYDLDHPQQASGVEDAVKLVESKLSQKYEGRLYLSVSDSEAIIAAVRQLAGDRDMLDKGYHRTIKERDAAREEITRLMKFEQNEKNLAESLRLMKENCVDKCGHPAEYVCYYEDGTRHCLECEAMKLWAMEKTPRSTFKVEMIAMVAGMALTIVVYSLIYWIMGGKL